MKVEFVLKGMASYQLGEPWTVPHYEMVVNGKTALDYIAIKDFSVMKSVLNILEIDYVERQDYGTDVRPHKGHTKLHSTRTR